VNNKIFCTQTLTEETAEKLKYAIQNRYWYEFFIGAFGDSLLVLLALTVIFIDDLPVWGFVGDVSEAGKVYMWTHLAFVISYNQDRVR